MWCSRRHDGLNGLHLCWISLFITPFLMFASLFNTCLREIWRKIGIFMFTYTWSVFRLSRWSVHRPEVKIIITSYPVPSLYGQLLVTFMIRFLQTSLLCTAFQSFGREILVVDASCSNLESSLCHQGLMFCQN